MKQTMADRHNLAMLDTYDCPMSTKKRVSLLEKEKIMKKITEMNPTEFRELLHTLVNEELSNRENDSLLC